VTKSVRTGPTMLWHASVAYILLITKYTDGDVLHLVRINSLYLSHLLTLYSYILGERQCWDRCDSRLALQWARNELELYPRFWRTILSIMFLGVWRMQLLTPGNNQRLRWRKLDLNRYNLTWMQQLQNLGQLAKS
jgi:hypothetical protein